MNSTRLLLCNVWTVHGEHGRIFRLHVWFTASSNRAGICIVRFVMKNPTSWNDQIVFWTTLKIQMYLKNTYVFWQIRLWYQLLIRENIDSGLETLKWDKTSSLSLIKKKNNFTYIKEKKNSCSHPLFSLSSISLFIFHTKLITIS
jgi:hypothetical protein